MAPGLLGLVADRAGAAMPGAECAVAGAMMLLGALGLALLGGPLPAPAPEGKGR